MSKRRIIRVSLGPDDPVPVGDTDWAMVDAMTDEEVTAVFRQVRDQIADQILSFLQS